MAAGDLAPALAALHEVTVELRGTFLTPAAPGLAAVAAPAGSGGAGEFTIEDVPPGDYVLVIMRPGYLTRCMNVTVPGQGSGAVELAPPGADPMDDGAFVLWWGDCDGDLAVGDGDILMMQGLWNASANDARYDPACDLDANGRVDNSDALMLMERYGYSAGDYAGAGDVDFQSGQGIAGSTAKLALTQGCAYRVPVTARNAASFAGKQVTVTYDQTALKLITAAEQAYGTYASAGAIPGSGATVASAAPGTIVLTFEADIPQGGTWTGLITIIKFEALKNGATTVLIE